MALEPQETAEASDFPCCRQLSVFMENRLGQLLRLTRLFDTADVHILALSVDASVDCSIVRLIVDDPDTARALISNAGFAVSESELLVVELPHGRRGIITVCAALIAGEVNIHDIYALIRQTIDGNTCLAIQVDNLMAAVQALSTKGFRVLDQSDLR